jgi:thymidylate kinase
MGYFAANRKEHRDEVIALLHAGDMVVYDRYVPSSVAFMVVEASYGKEITDTLRSEVTAAVETLEYTTNSMPKEDVSVFFDIPPKIAIDLLKGRKKEQGDEGEYTDYLSVQEALHREYVQLAEARSGHVLRISCIDGERLRTIEEIGFLVRTALAQKFPDKAQLFA